MTIVPLRSQTAGHPLSLASYVITSRGIVSSLDITWSINGTVLSRTIGAVGVNLLYTTFHNISLLTTDDDRMVYECDVVINSSPPVRHNDTHQLDVDGMSLCIGLCMGCWVLCVYCARMPCH